MQDQDVLVDEEIVISKGQKDARQEQRRINQNLRLTETASYPSWLFVHMKRRFNPTTSGAERM